MASYPSKRNKPLCRSRTLINYAQAPPPDQTPPSADMLYLRVPIGERHHDVEGRQGEHQVEEGPAVGDALVLVVPDLSLGVLRSTT